MKKIFIAAELNLDTHVCSHLNWFSTQEAATEWMYKKYPRQANCEYFVKIGH